MTKTTQEAYYDLAKTWHGVWWPIAKCLRLPELVAWMDRKLS